MIGRHIKWTVTRRSCPHTGPLPGYTRQGTIWDNGPNAGTYWVVPDIPAAPECLCEGAGDENMLEESRYLCVSVSRAGIFVQTKDDLRRSTQLAQNEALAWLQRRRRDLMSRYA